MAPVWTSSPPPRSWSHTLHRLPMPALRQKRELLTSRSSFLRLRFCMASHREGSCRPSRRHRSSMLLAILQILPRYRANRSIWAVISLWASRLRSTMAPFVQQRQPPLRPVPFLSVVQPQAMAMAVTGPCGCHHLKCSRSSFSLSVRHTLHLCAHSRVRPRCRTGTIVLLVLKKRNACDLCLGAFLFLL